MGIRTNLIPNPSFEVGTTGWTSRLGSPTLSSDATYAWRGSRALKMVATQNAVDMAAWTDYIPVPSGTGTDKGLRVAAKVYCPSGGVGIFRLVTWFYDAANTSLGGLGFDYSGVPTAGWVEHRLLLPEGIDTPAGTTSIRVELRVKAAGTGEAWYFDAVQAEASDFLAGSGASYPLDVDAYFDGDTADTANVVNQWEGTPHNSGSTQIQKQTTNYLINPSFEYSTTSPWHPNPRCTIAKDATAGRLSGAALRVTATTSGQLDVWDNASVPSTPCSPNTYYVAGGWIRAASATSCTAYVNIAFYDSSGQWISGYGWSDLATTTYTQIKSIVKSPANAANVEFNLRMDVAAVGEIFYLDDAFLYESINFGAQYFDGDTPDGEFVHAWTGTASQSTSTSTQLAPEGLVATPVSTTQINVSWNAVAGTNVRYDVERDGVIVANKISATSYADTGLTPGTLYSYRVRAAQ